jgi:transposase
MEVTHEGRRYVIAGGEWRRQRDAVRRQSRIQKAAAELKRLAAVQRRKVDPQKLASQVGRTLARLKAHPYFDYHVDAGGKLRWSPRKERIDSEEKLDGWYVLHTNLAVEQCSGAQTLAHYKNLLEVEEAFCQLKSYLEVRPVFHWRPDRVRNHIRICFLAYWLSAQLGLKWRSLGEKGEVPRLLRQMQTIRVGTLCVKKRVLGRKITQVPPEMNALLKKLNLLNLFSQPPDWAPL